MTIAPDTHDDRGEEDQPDPARGPWRTQIHIAFGARIHSRVSSVVGALESRAAARDALGLSELIVNGGVRRFLMQRG